MKRIFHLSLVIALLDMPHSIILNLLISANLYKLRQEHVNIIIKEHSALYKVISKLSGLTSADLLVLYVAWMALVFLFAWRIKIFSKENGSYWKMLKDKRKTHPGWWKWLIGRLVFVAVFSVSLLYLESYIVYGFFVKNQLALFESFNWRALPMSIILIPPKFFFVFCAISSIIVAATSVTHADFRENLKVPIVGLVVLLLVILTSLCLQHYLDLGKSLKNISGCSKETEPRELFILYEQPVKMAQEQAYFDVLSTPSAPLYIAYNANNIRVFNEYLKERGYYTAIKGAVNSYTLGYALRELDVERARRLCRGWLMETGAYEPSIVLSSLYFCPNYPEDYELLKWVSDESKFTINSKGSLSFSRAYANFGDMKMAKYWYDAYLRTRDKTTTEKPAEPPLNAPFNKGVVTGIINTGRWSMDGVRVGIIRKKSIDDKVERFKTTVPELSLLTVIEGVSPYRDGRFKFTGLIEGEYVILLSIRPVVGKKIKVLQSPGTIAVSKDKPSADLGTIRLVAE